MRRIGLLGGTFDPIHVGHLLLGQWAKEACRLDEVWFIPAGAPYQKDLGRVLPARERLEMTRLAVEGIEGMCVCDVEVQRDGATYTWETLEDLSQRHPDCAFFYILGADCLEGLETWRHPERLLERCDIIAAARNGEDIASMQAQARLLETRLGGHIHVMPFPNIEISSTMVRQRVCQGLSISFLVPESVERHIARMGYYSLQDRQNADNASFQ